MGQSVAESTITQEQLQVILIRQADQCKHPNDFLKAISFLTTNPDVLLAMGFINVKYYKALQHILKEQKGLTEEATEALIYNLGLY